MKVIALAFVLCATTSFAADWPQFRGPDTSGVSDAKDLPDKWGPNENVRWKADLPGRSVASPVVAGGRAYVVSASGVRHDGLHVLCFNIADGKQLWHRQIKATGNTGAHPKSSMAAPTPVATADGVYVLFATADLAAFDAEGNLRWYRSLAADYPGVANQVGMASSPILWKDKLIVAMDTVGDSFLLGIDTQDGKNAWKTDRPKDINWVTPTLRKNGDKTEVLMLSRFGLAAYDPANGNKLWNFGTEGQTIPTPVTMGDQVLINGKGLMCIKPKGDSTPDVLWTSTKLGSGACTPLVYKDHIYSVSGAGVLVCGDKNGKDLWQERLKKGKYWASPIAADGKIFVFNDEGICSVVQADPEKAEVVANNDLKEEIMGTPAIARDAIFIQTVSKLYCIGKKK